MATEDNKVLMCRCYEALNERDWAAFDTLCSPDFVYQFDSTTIQGLEPYKQFILMYFTAFPDGRLTIEDIIAEGDKVVARHTFHGTHRGTLIGIPPTGIQVTATGINISHFANGKAVEEWANYDDLGLLQQLGVVPAAGQTS